MQAGDRVGILSLNSDRYVEFFMAVPWAGAAVNPVNTRWSAAEIAYSLDDCDTQMLLIDDPFLPLLPELLQRTSSLRTLIHVGDGPTPDVGGVIEARHFGSERELVASKHEDTVSEPCSRRVVQASD